MKKYNLLAFCLFITGILLVMYLTTLHSRKKLNRLAYCDLLTGEMNLNKFKLETQKLMGAQIKSHAVMILDIDKFKTINDLYGYSLGDDIIVLMAKAIRASIQPGTTLCHGAADRFYLYFEFTDKAWIKELFDRIVININAAAKEKKLDCNLILSCGICEIQPEDKNIVSIIDRAGIASKQVKGYHESCFAFYDPSMYARLNQIRTLENNMPGSLKNHEFIVYLQPKIDILNYEIAGAEALIRWQHPEKGLILPGEFIPVFEENGFIINLDYYVLENVCVLLEKWKAEGKPLFPISVNLSRRHLFHGDTVERISAIVSQYDVETSLIEVELTESAFDNCNVATIQKLLDDLHESGFTVSVDDFGAGYSSLSLLKDLPIDVLKIDKSFFDGYTNCKTEKMAILLESVISLSRRLGIKTVSEGVETQQQLNLLLQLGCDLVQGFYFARPMLPEHLEKLLEIKNTFGDA